MPTILPKAGIAALDLSIVIPCLNEEKTLGSVIREANETFGNSNYSYEIIVADNGSTDSSPEIAESLGAKVVPVSVRGYGAAILQGVKRAQGSIVIFVDADFTYDLSEGPLLINRLRQGDVDMVMGSRVRGNIHVGAMPLLHRYLGTPVLTRLINILFKSKITDCNSGFRALRREKFTEWQIHSTGMEFASELIVSCLKAGGTIAEVPITLRKDGRGRPPHLSKWRDGMRHLLFILSRASHGFTYVGLMLLVLSLIIALPAAILGPIKLGFLSIFDFHSMLLAILIGFCGAQCMVYGLLLDSQSKEPLPVNAFFLHMGEVVLLKMMLGLVLTIFLFLGFITFVWWRHGFGNINYVRSGTSFLYIVVVLGALGFGIFIAQVHRRL